MPPAIPRETPGRRSSRPPHGLRACSDSRTLTTPRARGLPRPAAWWLEIALEQPQRNILLRFIATRYARSPATGLCGLHRPPARWSRSDAPQAPYGTRWAGRPLRSPRGPLLDRAGNARQSQGLPVNQLAPPSLPNPGLPARVAPIFLARILCQRSTP
jgi:hypothetical protein